MADGPRATPEGPSLTASRGCLSPVHGLDCGECANCAPPREITYDSRRHAFRDQYGVSWVPAARFDELYDAIVHVVNDSPGTPESVKGYLRGVL